MLEIRFYNVYRIVNFATYKKEENQCLNIYRISLDRAFKSPKDKVQIFRKLL